jgi:ABC-2 type transport system permease protein
VIDSLPRIYSQIYKNMMSMKRNSFRLADVFVWPMLFLFTLTFFVTYVGSDAVYLNLIILGMMGWRVIYFLNLEMVGSFTEEYWSKSLPHLMMSPITRFEMALGSALSGLIKSVFVIFTYLILTHFLYGFWITDWATFSVAIFFLAAIGFSLGLFTLGLGYFMKQDAFNIAFIIPDVVVLISGVYFSVESVYPASVLPFIRLLPSTYAFDVLKSMVGMGEANIPVLAALTALWIAIAYMFNSWMFELARKSGKLTRLG